MKTLALRNYKNFQHYKDRRPPWVKFHVDFLDDPELSALSPATRLVAALLTLVASVKDNRIPESPAWLAAECNVSHREAKIALADLLAIRYLVPASEIASDVASTPASESAPETLAPPARPPARGEAEAEAEEKERTSSLSSDLEQMKTILTYANTKLGHKWKLLDVRKAKLRARLREGYSEEQLMAVVDGVLLDPWDGRRMSGNDDPKVIYRDGAQVDKFLELAAGRINGNHVESPAEKHERQRRELAARQADALARVAAREEGAA